MDNSGYNYWKKRVRQSQYPANFIPHGGEVFIGVDLGSPDGDCTVKGFYKDGVLHVQDVESSQHIQGE